MAMFPVFIIGILAGIICTCLWYNFKKDTPSEVKLKLLEAEIISLKSDNEMLMDCVQKKDAIIKQIKQQQEVDAFKNKK